MTMSEHQFTTVFTRNSMKKICSVVFVLMVACHSAFAQAPERMSYQSVIRNAGNNLVINQSVGLRISILQGTSTGTVSYQETQTATTNINGLVSVQIGAGAVLSGTFSAIDWANGPYFVKTETDPTGGTSYSISGTTQLLSVPYALYAKSGGSGDNLGNHTATTNLNLSNNNITAVNNVTVSGTARLGGNNYPTNSGTNGQVLTTNGAGSLSWGNSGGGSGASLQLVVAKSAATSQTTNVGNSNSAPDLITFDNVIVTPTAVATWTNNNTFSVSATGAGLYLVNVSLIGNFISCVPMLDINGVANGPLSAYGVSGFYTSTAQNPHKARGNLTTIIYMNAGDYFQVRGMPTSFVIGADLSTDGTTLIKVVKLN
jgi:hypothetical protein